MKRFQHRLLLLFTSLLCLVVVRPISAEDAGQALTLIHALGCKGCHTLHGDGATLAPELSSIGERYSADQIAAFLAAQPVGDRRHDPSFAWVKEEQRHLIGSYLSALRKK